MPRGLCKFSFLLSVWMLKSFIAEYFVSYHTCMLKRLGYNPREFFPASTTWYFRGHERGFKLTESATLNPLSLVVVG